ncbi:metal ABC transporter ATP-binding protein [Bacillus carboniphilus]|uniref:Metal ABC transporter ATP-binding protein n=1 Tax=Bacillus carboniphilus TaxID=86663 RepID=A0ABY9JZP2_9BACI|nr:metal ABC transporter ATP-binding protein [Bacillus carboniphilus]WLR43963.1 metal ABC transporter ATP-binding protein [Bacillus carboniphilus]
MTNNPIVKIEHLNYKYNKQNALENINFTIEKGSFVGLVGPNGSGKSTLLKCMLGLNQVQQGKIELFGHDIKDFREWDKIGFISQKANSFNSGFPASVFEVVQSGLTKLGLFKRLNKKDIEKVKQTIESVGLNDMIDRNIGELSGGQQQRAFIARALVSDPELLILDEPTVGVDVENVDHFYRLLESLNKLYGITLLLVTHDIGTITDKVTHVACLNKSLHFYGGVDLFQTLNEQDVSNLYGHSIHVLSHHHR